jgi:D-alanyl-D-alanine carboxypeptidase
MRYFYVFLLTLASISLPTQPNLNTIEAASDTVENLKKKLLKIAKKQNIPAFDIVIEQGDETFQLSYHHPKLPAQTVYGIGSTTKLLAATIIFKLIEEGKLDRNAPISTYLENLPNQKLGNITIAQLLNHTSGLSDYTKNPKWIQQVINGKAPKTFETKLKLINTTQDYSGTFTYSNTNYTFLEEIVSKITEQPFYKVFNDFYKELGFKSIQIGETPNNAVAFFAQTDKQSSNVSSWREHYGFDGGAYATTAELNTLLQKLFVEKSILKATTLRDMQTWIPMKPMEIPLGKDGKLADYGFGIMKLSYKEHTYIGHSGGTLKYQSFVFYNEVSHTKISFVSNCSGRHYNKAFFQEMIPEILEALQ